MNKKNNFIQKNFHYSLNDVLKNNSKEVFEHILNDYLNNFSLLQRKNHNFINLSGFQPKISSYLDNENKENLLGNNYIIKTFNEDFFPNLGLNEYICMSIAKEIGLEIPKFYLSDDQKLFIIERFDFDKNTGFYYGLEDFCSIKGVSNDKKYNGSYSSIANLIKKLSSNQQEDLEKFFKLICLNSSIKNGDAHFKNFSMLYHTQHNLRLSPVYDLVNTSVYSYLNGLDKFGRNIQENFALSLNKSGNKKGFPSTFELSKFGLSLGLNKDFIQNSLEEIFEKKEKVLLHHKDLFSKDFFENFSNNLGLHFKTNKTYKI